MTRSLDGPMARYHSLPVFLLDLDGQPFDFLIQRGERYVEAFRRFGLVPAALLQHVNDGPPLAVFHDAEQRTIIDMLEKCGWNQTEAAERFHVPLSTLNQKIKRLAIEIKKKNRE